ncbi:hypothetical protein BDW69DRAFT_167118 [Aspergillus filifer]
MAPVQAQAQSNNLPRPETDYERWLREQDKNYESQEDPVYEPNSQNRHKIEEGGPNSHGTMIHPPTSIQHQTPSAGHDEPRLLGLERYSAGSKFLFSVLLVLVIVRSVRSFRRRAQLATTHEKA